MRTVAIACQGGGSHTAFTGGALQRLLADRSHRVVALSGTSGGAVCALLAWYGLLTGGAAEAGRLLERFWEANAATTLSGKVANAWLVGLARLEGRLSLPMVSPYVYPDIAGAAFTDLLTHHVDVDRLARLQESPREDQPQLLVGAADVLTGDFQAFSSRRREITVNAVLASAAVPLLFRAVEEKGRYYWDGLFSQNPPVRELPDAGPEEIWVIRINPRGRATEPKTVGDIADRRNELAGNLSLEQELYFIRKVNQWADRLGHPYRRIEIRELTLDLDLDLASKLDRRPAFLRRLFDAGRTQAEGFLAGLPG
ncbi:patatin-like phospholipase family protein [Geodermatophilus sabuli]|uniref:NTE family protein n=1 Tax=Geodermatophilus sabuli TaxID=1564158 RepID=A0A285E6P8_9ACTN|nr:patatin-like phospholipase family protein [Geodermatophilus sabuli]MBB3082490.1 NTE family protein [Geodermatophilus sabuli]SNX94640.1 NTE family protein [Geodermatophilus sabuli]